MDKKPTTPQELARMIRHQAVTSAALSDVAAMTRYADWLESMPVLAPQREGDRFPTTD